MNLRCGFRVLLAVLLLGVVGRVVADEEYPEGPEAGKALARDLTSKVPTENSRWQGVLKIFKKDQPMLMVPVVCETVVSSNGWSVSYQTDGSETACAEKLVLIFSKDASPKYQYQRANSPGQPLGEVKNFKGVEADIPFANSDFWLSDLAFEFYHWPNQIRHKGQMRRSRPCFGMESIQDNPTPEGYSRVMTWIEKESGAPIEAEAYGAGKTTYKDFELGSITKVNGRYEVKNLKMYDRRHKSKTFLEFDLDSK